MRSVCRPFALRRAALGLAGWVVASGLCGRAHADEVLTLSYSAPPGCPSSEAIESAVQRLATTQTQPYSASVVIETDQQRFTARIASGDGTGRTLVASTCEAVAEATAVVLALAISPRSAAPEPPRDQNLVRASGPRRSNPAPRPAVGPSIRFKLGAGGVLDLGTLPHLDLAAAARVGMTARTWSTALEFAYWLLPEHRGLTQNPSAGSDFSWWTLLGTGCAAPTDRPLRIELCAGPELGHLSGQGVQIAFPKDAGTFRFGFATLAEAHVPLSARLRLRGGFGAAAVLLGRRTFELDGARLYRPPVVSGRAALGAELIF